MSKDLRAELNKLTINRNSLRQSILGGVLASRRKGFVKKKQELLEKYQNVLTTHILTRLDTRSLKATHDIYLLDRNIQVLVQALDNGQSTVERLFADQKEELLEIRNRIDNQFESYTKSSTDHDAHQRFLESLFFPEIDVRQEKITEAFDQTCSWIFDEPIDRRQKKDRPQYNFPDWLRTGNGVYWISGKPGSGKSTLMKFLIDEERTVQLLDAGRANQELLVISFFFWSAGNDLQRSATGLLRSLLYQIAKKYPELVNIAKAQSSKSTYGVESWAAFRTAWTDQRLLCVLETFIGQMPAHISLCAFVDGLDEFVGDEDLLLDMVRLFSKASQCKICVSSRPEQAFRQEFQECPRLRMQDFNNEDIRRIATSKLMPVLKKHLDLSMLSYVGGVSYFVDCVIQKASGVFLWLDLMIKDLIKGARNGDTLEELQSRLERTPATIEGMYTHMLERLDPIYHEEGLKYFAILLAAQERDIPVTLLRIVCTQDEPWEHAIQFDLDYFTTTHFELACQRVENRLVACCGSLVEVSDCHEDEDEPEIGSEDEGMNPNEYTVMVQEDRVISFTHRTAMDYVKARYNNVLGPLSFMEAKISLAQGGIGFLALLSSRKKFRAKYHVTPTFGDSIQETMDTISALGHPSSDPVISEPSISMQIDLTNRMFRLLQELHNHTYESTQDCWSNETFTTHLLDPACSNFAKTLLIDHLSAAAFYGCNHYLNFQLSLESVEQEHATFVLESALFGIDRDLNRDSLSDSKAIIPKLFTLQTILKHKINPQKLYFMELEDSLLGIIRRCTLWGAFLYLLRHTLRRLSRLIQEHKICSIGLFEAFLLQGADPNTKIPRRWDIPKSRGGFYLLMLLQSPLDLIGDLASSIDSELCSELGTRLQSAGAAPYQEFLYLARSKDLSRYYPLWRLSKVQNEQLDELLFQSTSSNDRDCEIEALLEEIEVVDKDEVVRYMDTLGYSFTEV